MEQLNETAQVDRELEQARRDLRATLEQVNHKVEALEARLRPEAILRRNRFALPLVAGVIGFLAGSDHKPRPMRWLLIGAALGVFLAVGHRGTHNGGDATSE